MSSQMEFADNLAFISSPISHTSRLLSSLPAADTLRALESALGSLEILGSQGHLSGAGGGRRPSLLSELQTFAVSAFGPAGTERTAEAVLWCAAALAEEVTADHDVDDEQGGGGGFSTAAAGRSDLLRKPLPASPPSPFSTASAFSSAVAPAPLLRAPTLPQPPRLDLWATFLLELLSRLAASPGAAELPLVASGTASLVAECAVLVRQHHRLDLALSLARLLTRCFFRAQKSRARQAPLPSQGSLPPARPCR